VVAVEHQWMAQELEVLFPSKKFFRIRDFEALDRLVPVLQRRGEERFTLIRYAGEGRQLLDRPGYQLLLDTRGSFGSLVLVDVTIASTIAEP
jgi:hypothetical protein